MCSKLGWFSLKTSLAPFPVHQKFRFLDQAKRKEKGGPAASGTQVQVEAHWHDTLRVEGVDMASMVDSIGSPAPARRASTYGEVVDARRCVALLPTRPLGGRPAHGARFRGRRCVQLTRLGRGVKHSSDEAS